MTYDDDSEQNNETIEYSSPPRTDPGEMNVRRLFDMPNELFRLPDVFSQLSVHFPRTQPISR